MIEHFRAATKEEQATIGAVAFLCCTDTLNVYKRKTVAQSKPQKETKQAKMDLDIKESRIANDDEQNLTLDRVESHYHEIPYFDRQMKRRYLRLGYNGFRGAEWWFQWDSTIEWLEIVYDYHKNGM